MKGFIKSSRRRIQYACISIFILIYLFLYFRMQSTGTNHLTHSIILDFSQQRSPSQTQNERARSIGSEIFESNMAQNTSKATVFSNQTPLRFFEEYLLDHSSDILWKEAAPNNRSFVVAHYACPLEAGNRIHEFLNSMIFAMVLNRTVLWDFYDDNLCRKIRIDPNQCDAFANPDVCDKTLHRSSWIPSYDAFTKHLGLPPKDSGFPIDSEDQLHVEDSVFRLRRWNNHTQRPLINGIDEKLNSMPELRVVDFPTLVSYLDLSVLEDILKTEFARDRARRLYTEGTDFVYGMVSGNLLS